MPNMVDRVASVASIKDLERYQLETSQLLTISTAHLPVATRELLCHWKSAPTIIAPYDHGYFVWVSPEGDSLAELVEDPDFPLTLLLPMMLACRLGYTWLRFDADGPVIPGLTVYE